MRKSPSHSFTPAIKDYVLASSYRIKPWRPYALAEGWSTITAERLFFPVRPDQHGKMADFYELMGGTSQCESQLTRETENKPNESAASELGE